MEKETEKGLAEEGLIEPGELVLGVPVESVSRKRMRSPLSDVFLEKSINVCCFPCSVVLPPVPQKPVRMRKNLPLTFTLIILEQKRPLESI